MYNPMLTLIPTTNIANNWEYSWVISKIFCPTASLVKQVAQKRPTIRTLQGHLYYR